MLIDILQESPAFQEVFAQGEEKGRYEERQERIQDLRQRLFSLIIQRFPKLKRLAKRELSRIEQPQILGDLILNIALARTHEEAEDYLLTWDGQDEAEDECDSSIS